MKTSYWRYPALALTAVTPLILAGCGGSGGSPAGNPGSNGGNNGSNNAGNIAITQQQRVSAANNTVANNPACTSISSFYWEIGDQGGAQASGNGGLSGAAMPGATTAMLIASSSKWVFSTYVDQLRRGALSASDIKFLNFQSGYTNFSSCSTTATVASCLAEPGDLPGNNGSHFALTDGKFYYNGGHMQVLASSMSIATDGNAQLASDMQSVLGADVAITYNQPQLAGGIIASAAVYAEFLRNMLSGKYSYMLQALGTYPVCTHTNSSDCPSALYSPVNQSTPGGPNDISDERWHYSVGHWVEDDPTVGDGAFSSPGRYGFYPWIDASKTYYGVLARFDPANVGPADPTKAAYYTSVQCGRLIRKAWLSGEAQ